MSYDINDSIYNLHNDNNIATSNTGFIIKLRGKGSLDIFIIIMV
jgi:hypothetical protein